jgi:ribonuclease HII
MIGVDEVGRGCLAGPLLVVAARAKAELPSRP